MEQHDDLGVAAVAFQSHVNDRPAHFDTAVGVVRRSIPVDCFLHRAAGERKDLLLVSLLRDAEPRCEVLRTEPVVIHPA